MNLFLHFSVIYCQCDAYSVQVTIYSALLSVQFHILCVLCIFCYIVCGVQIVFGLSRLCLVCKVQCSILFLRTYIRQQKRETSLVIQAYIS